eukprot:c22735_g1_i1 orf=380-1618(-)
MCLRRFDFKWYDGFFLSMLATSAIVVSINWQKYHSCTYPLHIWIVVDYSTVFVFRILMFVDNWLAAGLGPDTNHVEELFRFYGRVAVLSFLAFFLYPFLWAWTVIGSLWFASARSCLPEGQAWGFLVWLLLSYGGLISVACLSTGKWLMRRQAHLQRVRHGNTVSELEVLVDLIRVPDWALEVTASIQELRGNGHEAAIYHPGLYLTVAQREAVESLIQQLPRFRLKTVPTECGECPICLEDFCVGNEARGLPCAHNFHVACIDEWLRLNIKCPRCRCSVFPNLDLSALASHPSRAYGVTSMYFGGDGARTSQGYGIGFTPLHNGRYIRAQPVGQSNLLRLQEILRTTRMENAMYNEPGEQRVNDIESNEGQRQPNIDVRQFNSVNPVNQETYPCICDTVSVIVDRSPPARF